MKKFKLFTTMLSFCFALAVLCFGVYAASTVDYTLSGNISYDVNDAYVNIVTKVYSSAEYYGNSGGYYANNLHQQVNNVLAGNVTGLNLVKTSETYNSTNATTDPAVGGFELGDLAFSSTSFTYIFVVEITNLGDNTVYGYLDGYSISTSDTYSYKANSDQFWTASNEVCYDLGKNETGKIVIAINPYDKTQAIAKKALNFLIKIECGNYSQSTHNLNKLTFKENGDGYSVKKNCTYSGTNSKFSGCIVVPSTYNGKTVNKIEGSNDSMSAQYTTNGFANAGVTYLYIEEGVVEISGYAFYGNVIFNEIQLPDSCTNVNANAFTGCTCTLAD